MHPTPELGHVTKTRYQEVYDPAEDTFLLLDALEADAEKVRSLQPAVCLEVGSGSGCVITFLGALLDDRPPLLLATDVNPQAAQCTAETAQRNSITSLQVVRTDIVNGLLPRLAGQVDILIFNPPYVATDSAEVGTTDLTAAWAGGKHGREVTDKLLPLVPQLLSRKGLFYLVTLPQNLPDEIVSWLARYGLQAKTIMTRTAGMERLSVLRFQNG